MQMSRLILCAAAVVAQAQHPVLVTGTLATKQGRPESARVGSVVARKVDLAQVSGAEAVLLLQSGDEVRLPCSVSWLEGQGPERQAIWRFSVPDLPPLKRIIIQAEGKELGRIQQGGKVQTPQMDFIATGQGDELSVAYSLKQPLLPGSSSMWVRWSTDGGATWDAKGSLLDQEDTHGTVDLDALAKVPEGKLVLEFWVLQGLTLDRLKYVVKRS